MIVRIGQANEEHARYIADHCREADRLELGALGVTPYQAMMTGLMMRGTACTGTVDGVPVCMFGVAETSMIGNAGRPWMVAADNVERYQIQFLRRNRSMVRKWLASYSILENYVDVRNTQAIKWLRWLGFKFDEQPVPMGSMRLPFYRFFQMR